MNVCFKLLVIFGLIGIVKASVRGIILAILGLMGLWMAHILAQDYQHITRPAQVIRHLLGKRAAPSSEINWDLVLSNDPIDCFKSFLCQISVNTDDLNQAEQRIWNVARNTDQLQQFLLTKDLPSEYCMEKYFRCPFKKETMTALTEVQDINKETNLGEVFNKVTVHFK